MSDRELEEAASAGGYAHNVVDLAGVRVAVGWRRRDAPKCAHKHLVYCPTERKIECTDCNHQVDPYDAFEVLTKHFTEMLSDARGKMHKANEAMVATVNRRAAKAVERSWIRGMAPSCPHCRKGLLAEDYERGVLGSVSRELEIARRKRALTEA